MSTIETIWLDCDPGLDDALAIILAACHERINLIGVSTSAGNTTLQHTTRNALDLLFNVGKQNIPVVKGSNQLIKGQMHLATDIHGSDGLGGVSIPQSPEKEIEEKNFEFIYKMIVSQPGQITWANTGSLTNLCLFLREFPDVLSKLKQIVIMGGSTGRGNRTPAAEFNIYFDPHAFDEVLKLKKTVPLVMVPLDTTNDVLCKDDVFEYLQGRISIPLANAIYSMLRSYQEMYKRAYIDLLYPIIHDPTVIYYILHPEKFVERNCAIVVDLCEISYGRTNVWYDDYGKKLQTVDKVTLKLKDVEGFWRSMIEVFEKIFNQVKI